jgi:thymidylate synthase (FAD)
MNDPWKTLRQELCFGNIEVEVELVAMTQPRGILSDWYAEELPALSASISYGSDINDYEKAENLNRKLIKMGHDTPLEAVTYNFRVSGISKLCGSQLSRHRIGQGHVSGSRRYRKQEPAFVYPTLEYVKSEDEVRAFYGVMSTGIKDAYERYEQLRQVGVKRSDARYLIPASTASSRMWWVNCRALRNFFNLRLAPDAEWEIRRLATIILGIVTGVTPSLFEDIYHEAVRDNES